MTAFSRRHIKLPTARLSRRIVFWVFISVVAIEAIILVPSYKNRQDQLLQQLKEISQARISLTMELAPAGATDEEILKEVRLLADHPVILGGTLYTAEGRDIGTFGEPPELPYAEAALAGNSMRLYADGTRFDVMCPSITPNARYHLILRHDATSVQKELSAFVRRIAGLILLISLFVTAGAWIALGPIVITPILRLRNDLIQAGESVSNDRGKPQFYASRAHRHDELGDVIAAFNQMYHRITDAIDERKQAEAALQKSLQQVESYSRALNAELEKGRRMQNNFLPGNLIQKPGWEIAAFFNPAKQVAGDFYDLFDLPENRLGIVIADVCDKGVGAALFMALFRSLIRIFSGQIVLAGLECPQPEEAPQRAEACESDPQITPLRAVRYTNDYIARNHGELAMFATLFFGVLDLQTGRLAYISGGHEPLLVHTADADAIVELPHTGPAVGIEEGIPFEIGHTRLHPGDALLGYTDGVIEAQSPDGKFFSQKRLLSVLAANNRSAADLIDAIKTEVLTHTGQAAQFDDITMIALRRSPREPS